MTDLAPFPDVEVTLCALLADLGRCGTETPADLAAHLPFHRVTVYGGRDDLISDLTRVDVDTFAGTKAAAAAAAEAVRQRLITRGRLVAGTVLDRVVTDTRPRQVPWAEGSTVVRYTAAYAVSTRR